ncbi:MAG: polyribonucleotide nucleotidyltransferase [Patescibacteria group bacterium]|nr:polyribonucleotide nucleotidyltransferase [Patescibacteria group bacterium]MDD5172940.1 polyribonucleotide nucleotidyltransferase [Patescibacteria group bacterium]
MEFKKQISEKQLIVKIGDLARQSNGSCVVQYGETTVLATAVLGAEEKELDYFPLSVEYEEKFYAAGKIKGSRFIKRETRPPDEAVLTGRLIDRSIRPLFSQEYRRAVQVILTVLSVDQENDPDIVALWAASIALSISDISWNGPIAGVRVSRFLENNESNWVINPSYEVRAKSDLDLVVCGAQGRVIMVEAGAKEIKNNEMAEAIKIGLEHLGEINDFIKEIQVNVGKQKIPLVADLTDEEVLAKAELRKITEDIVKEQAPKYLFEKHLKTKEERIAAAEKIRAKLDEILLEKQIGKEKRVKAMEYANKLIYQQVSLGILNNNQRIDGRNLDEIRPIDCQVSVLPRVHGSAIFSRGETQVLSIVTLAAPGSEQYLDTMEESGRKRFMHHYNFPPFCSGEVKHLSSTGRREIGHGALAEKGIIPVLPPKENFPHTIRIVSEVLSSNGSTSMASVCASVLSAMDAGIPLSKPVAGIAIGLASEEDEKGFKRYKIITDIQDLEDGPGGMDFKVVGTDQGITAVQMDTKTKGLTLPMIDEILDAASKARLEVLNKMRQVLESPRPELSPYAPQVIIFKINPDKIRDVIGPGGRVINDIINHTGAMIDIEQDGSVSVTSPNKESLQKAVEWIKNLTREIVAGEVFEGKVTRIMDFGAFVELIPGQEGMVHVSEMDYQRVEHPNDLVKVDDLVKVKVMEIDKQGRINLSMKALKTPPEGFSGNYVPRKRPARRPFRSSR